jgi:hypothetical protein
MYFIGFVENQYRKPRLKRIIEHVSPQQGGLPQP